MRCFSEDCNELREFLQSMHIHDGMLQYAVYDQITKKFVVHVENNVWNDSLDMVFVDVCKFSSIADYKWSNDETVNAFVLITNENCDRHIDTCKHKDKLCFVWEMFSGNRISVVCSELRISSIGDECDKTSDSPLSLEINPN